MKIKLFTLPNILTLGNLICGVVAIQAIVSRGDLRAAFLLIILAALFDFLDGFAARLLNQSSPLGGELDSLADMVSFGVVPTLIMIDMIGSSQSQYISYVPFAIVACSALRLAKFNIDDSQSDVFVGLPTPACALFCAALGLMHSAGIYVAGWLIIALSLLLSWLLISPIKMFALKFKGFGTKGNEVRYGFVLFSAALLCSINLGIAIATIIASYVAVSLVMHLSCNGNNCSK